jgi:hypothetical protein
MRAMRLGYKSMTSIHLLPLKPALILVRFCDKTMTDRLLLFDAPEKGMAHPKSVLIRNRYWRNKFVLYNRHENCPGCPGEGGRRREHEERAEKREVESNA